MTEEIIIDGVDVAGCEFFDNGEAGNACLLGYREDAIEGFTPNCIDNLCYYKQLKRLEQENNELKMAKITIPDYVKMNEQIDELKQENETLREKLKNARKKNL